MYAGFWKRFFANLLDSIIVYFIAWVMILISLLLSMVFGVLGYYVLENWPGVYQIYNASGYIIGLLIAPLAVWLYYAIMESSKLQGTLGKMALGIIVVNERYERVSFWRASGRFWSRMVSLLTIYIGYVMAGFTKKKQALHDKIARTYVVDKRMLEMAENYNAQNPPQFPGGESPGAFGGA
ncbi:RDD family protein [Paenibacillus macerans]|uniref:RDD family protein n=1 Tax=Paenibacillus macerans TaxID=44252 RepID=UPI002DB9C2F2|nr:RDD family protein [Paenibacillus macerans]MEC0330038.1 RDD family protein [Paenibacillus macerans]